MGYSVAAPAPTGVAATDTAALNGVFAANTVIQLQAGTYVVNQLNDMPSGCILVGWPPDRTTVKLATQADFTAAKMLGLGSFCGLAGIVLDGNSSGNTIGVEWNGLVQVVGQGAYIVGCTFQNLRTSGVYSYGGGGANTTDLTVS